jgi:hypothetical protein
MLKRSPSQGLNLLPEIRVIPHFNKFFKWIPDSAAKVLLHAPDGTILLGIDELTALVQRTGTTSWKVQGEQLVHIVSGLPQAQFKDGDELTLTL